MRKQSVKHGIQHIGGGKRIQIGGANPFAALAVPENLGGVIFKKVLEVVEENDIEDDAMVREKKIRLPRRANPQKVTLPIAEHFTPDIKE